LIFEVIEVFVIGDVKVSEEVYVVEYIVFFFNMRVEFNFLNKTLISSNLTNVTFIQFIFIIQLVFVSQVCEGVNNYTEENIAQHHDNKNVKNHVVKELAVEEGSAVFVRNHGKDITNSTSISDTIVNHKQVTLQRGSAEVFHHSLTLKIKLLKIISEYKKII
jgi:hypothetical protein